ncbi:MAG: hypothetical protein B9S37_09190 [Verrucomicrobiia bacterium Tous-C3TDCM]|nr:MAG: hypothetical protein B9S37_09190 [Verrucomicrobiae bacterium Tous-C3TDCM]
MQSTYLPINRLRLRRFRSLLWSDITFANPLFIVGKNGSGKSNFLKALEFLSDCLRLPLESVFQLHGGLENMRYRSGGRSRPGNFGLRVDFTLPNGDNGWYAFEIKAMPGYKFEVVKEQCVSGQHSFTRSSDEMTLTSRGIALDVTNDSLMLPLLGGTSEFKPVKELLSGISVFSLEPRAMQEQQDPDAGMSLKSDGSNLASVLQNIKEDAMERLCQLLGKIVPGVSSVTPLKHGKKLTLKFTQTWEGEGEKVEENSHEAFSMSDGTLRILGILTTFFQNQRPQVIALEEPESTIHPEALMTLLEQIRGFSKNTQFIVTTHSPELLDCEWIEPENIQVATWCKGVSQIHPLGESGRKTLQQHLMGAGEMMRTEGLNPQHLFEPINPEQGELFSKLP